MSRYKHFFGFQRDPFPQDVNVEDLYSLPGLKALAERFLYALDLGAISVITGEVGTGKSTSLRYASAPLHPSQYRILPVTANTGTILEILKQILLSLQVESRSLSITLLTQTLRSLLSEITARKQQPLLIIDEAHLMRIEVFAQLHTLLQFDFDSKPRVTLILCGQNTLLDKLMYHSSRPLASRVVGRSHLEGLTLKEMEGYLNHHLKIAGVKEQLFAEEAILAIQQGSGGLLRRANHLARGALVAAALEKNRTVSAEHVRAASTEII
jgi:general secretion pathway protein A